MVDCVTQWVLTPIHDLIFQVLSCLPTDGTFDQLKPLQRLLDRRPKLLYSLDLSNATDRLPIAVQERVLSLFLGDKISSL